MEDSFRVRVDKAFGSLSSASFSKLQTESLSLSSLWCLTDEEIERSQWNRDHKDSPETEFQPSNRERPDDMAFKPEIEKDIDDLDDDSEEESRGLKPKPEDYNDEEWDIWNSIGLDCTLDYEEEEDQYDKIAVGKQKCGDDHRLYMTHINDYGIDVDSANVMPNSFADATRDPRANHHAAKIRLKQDAEAAENMDSWHNITSTLDYGNLKSILKRRKTKYDQSDSKSFVLHLEKKRVRFDQECNDGNDKQSEGGKDTLMENSDSIPDYIQNPSKYTCYAFDSSTDVDEESNQRAYMDFLEMLPRTNSTESQPGDVPVDLSKPLTFIPKKKAGDATVTDISKQKDSKTRLGIAACDTHDCESCVMEEDDPETAPDFSNLQRPGRQYRIRVRLET